MDLPRGVGRGRREDLPVVVVVEGRRGAHVVPPLLRRRLLRLLQRGRLLGRPTSVLEFHDLLSQILLNLPVVQICSVDWCSIDLPPEISHRARGPSDS